MLPEAPVKPLTDSEALQLSTCTDTAWLTEQAGRQCESGHGKLVTYSRKIFLPLTRLCRDVCHYCTFAKTPRNLKSPFMSMDEVLRQCESGAAAGCQEALLTLGEKPELRYGIAREALAELGHDTTVEYVTAVAERIMKDTGLLPHINAGTMERAEIDSLRKVSASMGLMLESASDRLGEKGMPHHGSPDKVPAVRLQTLALAGEAGVPFTTGILIGIGETRIERIESLLAIRQLHERHGHIQEIIIQNFRAKPETRMALAPEPDLEDLLWTLAVTRLIFGPTMSVQAPPNLSPGVLPQLIHAGINDWGGVSPLTPDYVNPEAPWPHLEQLAAETEAAGKFLEQRLTLYPKFVKTPSKWVDKTVLPFVLSHSDSDGLAKRDSWHPGTQINLPKLDTVLLNRTRIKPSAAIEKIVASCLDQETPGLEEVTALFQVRGDDFSYVTQQANALRRQHNGESVSYVVNRNINYTNVCYFKCRFCAFSKGRLSENLRGRPYDISGGEIARRCLEAWERGATEVCMQGGIHPDYTGATYLDIVQTVKQATPHLHLHAFSPLEVWQGAQTLGISLEEFLHQLQHAGLGTLPGTAAEVLHDGVRRLLCPDKINSAQWLQVMEAAHDIGFNTTATIMFGHVDRPEHWAAHLLAIRQLQSRSGGFTEFVPLPYVHMEAPLFLQGKSRRGPSYREALLMHAVPRLVFHGAIDNIQTSWVKMGKTGALQALDAGANDLGGTLMNESITRAAGSEHGQEWQPAALENQLRKWNRIPRMRTTLYRDAPDQQRQRAMTASELLAVQNPDAGKHQRSKRLAQLASIS